MHIFSDEGGEQASPVERTVLADLLEGLGVQSLGAHPGRSGSPTLHGAASGTDTDTSCNEVLQGMRIIKLFAWEP